jgi:hypothetical protein
MQTSLPIYYGTREVFDIFDEDSFIFYDIEDPDRALNLIRYLENNQTEYERRLSAPVFKNGVDTVDKYFSFIPSIGRGTLNKRIRAMMGLPPFDPSFNRKAKRTVAEMLVLSNSSTGPRVSTERKNE